MPDPQTKAQKAPDFIPADPDFIPAGGSDPTLLTSSGSFTTPPRSTVADQVLEAVPKMGTGALKGVGHTLTALSPLINKTPFIGETLAPSMGIKAAESMFTPKDAAEKVGFEGEQIGEWLLPTGAEEKAGLFAARMLPKLGKVAPALGRIGAGAIESGVRNKLQGGDFGTGALMGGGTGVLGETGKAVAPKVAESALGITNRMRGRGKTIGQAVLDETKGVRPATIATESGEKIGALTKEMESAVHDATQQGVTGTTQSAHDVLNEAIKNTPRNARELRDKLESLREVLSLTQGKAGQAPRMIHSPDELLEIRRGIGKTIKAWPPEWQRIDDVKRIQQRLYGAIDSELDRLVGGNAEINQRISSLIPAKKAAQKLETSASLPQKMAHRMLAHTGALMGASAGGAYGYKEGGVPGAVVGGISGLVLPEVMASPTAQMAAARVIRSPKTVQLGRGMTSQFMRRGSKDSSLKDQGRSKQ